MKKFLKKITVYFVIIALLICSIEFFYRKNNKEDNDDVFKYYNMPKSIDICNLGSSHGQLSFNYNKYQNYYSCFNFGLSGQTLSYDYRILNNYQDRIHDGSIVIITVSYFSICGNDEEMRDDFESKNKKYYKILKPENIKKYHIIDDLLAELTSMDTGVNNLILSIIGKNENRNLIDSHMTHTTTKNEVIEMLRKDGLYENEYNGNNFNKNEISSLINIINLTKEKKAIPVIVTTPITIDYCKTFENNNNNFFEEFYTILNEISLETGAEYFDYGKDIRFSNNYDYFFDYHHLNNKGSEVFTDIIFEEVISKYYEK